MTLVFPLLDQPLCFTENHINVLVIENPVALRECIQELSKQLGGDAGEFVLAVDYIPQDLSSIAAMLTDIFHPGLDSRKITNKVNQLALESADSHAETVHKIIAELNELAATISCEMEFDVTFDELENPAELIRALSFRIDQETDELAPVLLGWMRLQRMFFGKRLFIIYGLKACMDADELVSFYRSVFYEKLNVLLIEAFQKDAPLPMENLTIIDKDLCNIY